MRDEQNIDTTTIMEQCADAPAKNAPKKSSKKAGAPKAKKSARAKKAAARAKSALKTSDRTNKKAEVIALMKRSKGVTLAEIMETTGWQAHTVRGFVSILGSKGGLFHYANSTRYQCSNAGHVRSSEWTSVTPMIGGFDVPVLRWGIEDGSGGICIQSLCSPGTKKPGQVSVTATARVLGVDYPSGGNCSLSVWDMAGALANQAGTSRRSEREFIERAAVAIKRYLLALDKTPFGRLQRRGRKKALKV